MIREAARIYSEQTVSITTISATEPLVRTEGNSMHSPRQPQQQYEQQNHPVNSVGFIRSTTQQQHLRMRATITMRQLPRQRQQQCLRQRLLLLPLALLLITMLDENYLGIAISNNIRLMIVTTNAYTAIHRRCGHVSSSSSIQPITLTIPLSKHLSRQQRLPFIIPKQQKLQPLQGYRSMSSLLSSSSNSDSDTINGSDANPSSSSAKTNDDTKSNDDAAQQRKQFEEDAKKMKVGELKQILESQGISTKTYIEKSEFIKAYVQFRMDGGSTTSTSTSTSTTTKKTDNSSSSSNKKTSSTSSSSSQQKDTKDPEYRDVVIYKMNRSDPRMLQGTMIDITIPK